MVYVVLFEMNLSLLFHSAFAYISSMIRLKSCVRMMLAMVEDSLISLRSLMDKTTIEFDFVIKKLMHSWE